MKNAIGTPYKINKNNKIKIKKETNEYTEKGFFNNTPKI